MNLKHLSDKNLLDTTKALAQRERELLTEMLHHLREIERRRLFSTLGFRSLFDYATKILGYSQDQAYRRIEAMRALKDLPEIEGKISSGAISLTNLSMAQKLFRQKKLNRNEFSKSEKLKIIEKLEYQTSRAAEQIIVQIAPIEAKEVSNDRFKSVGLNQYEVRLVLDEDMRQMIEKLKGLLAHSNPYITTTDLFRKLCELGIQQWDPGQKLGAPRKRCVMNSVKLSKGRAVTKSGDHAVTISEKLNRTIPVAAQREIWGRANSRCENCASVHALEIDHITPKALGGSNELENLRLLCRSCNQRKAINAFGQMKMDRYLV